MKFYIIILTTLILLACTNQNVNDQKKIDSETLTADNNQDLSEDWNLSHSLQIENEDIVLNIADSFYNKIKPETNCDEILKECIDSLELVINEIDSLNWSKDWQVNEEKEKELLKKGIHVDYSEGMGYLTLYHQPIISIFKPCLSKELIKYLDNLDNESIEGCYDDGGIIVSFKTIAKRMLYRKELIDNNPNFIFIDDCKEAFNYFVGDLIYGSDNSRVYLNDNSVKEAYLYIIDKSSNPELNKSFKQFYDSVKANNFKENDKTSKLKEQLYNSIRY
ncbi:MAG: hypothetical protein COA33_014555 [Fluviicola sp.]|nr:hypothetical protein [Fluviicola sp.]